MEDKELREILETSLKQAFEYAFNKGIKSDYEPDHDRAKAIRDEALAQIQAHYEAKIVETKLQAKIDELDITPSHASVDMAAYKQNRRAELVAQLELKKEKH